MPATHRPMALCGIIGLVVLIAPGTISASSINGGFEWGLAGWQGLGDVSVVDGSLGATPVEGRSQALLTTASQAGDANNFSGTDAAPAADLEAFLGLPAGALVPGFEGSALRRTFTVNEP